MGSQSSQNSSADELQPWKPEQYVRPVSAQEARYASGFLRSRPERWFPGFSAHWLPLAHSLGWDLRCLDIKPVIISSSEFNSGFVASVDDELIGLALDEQTLEALITACVPGVSGSARGIIVEYLARRFLQSLSSVWSASEQAIIRYEADKKLKEVRSEAAIEIIFSLNSVNLKATLLLGRGLTDRFDGLWRRQLMANSRVAASSKVLELELTHLLVAPTMLTQYLKSGTDIDLDQVISDKITVYTGEQPWLTARMVRIEERLGIQVVNTNPARPKLPEGTTRLSIQLGQINLTPEQQVELSQTGAILKLDFNISDQVKLVVANQSVGTARLRVYQGRYAITVI